MTTYVAMESLAGGYMPYAYMEADTASEAWRMLRDKFDEESWEVDDDRLNDIFAEFDSMIDDGDTGTIYAPSINDLMGTTSDTLDIAYEVGVSEDA